MSQVVGAKLHLKAILSLLETVWTEYSSIVDQDVNLVQLVQEDSSTLPNRLERRQVKLFHLNIVVTRLRLDVRESSLGSFEAPTENDDLGSSLCQVNGSLLAYAGVGT